MDSDLVAALADSAQQVLEDFCTSTRRHRLIDEGVRFDQDLWATMAELGWLSLALPEEHGGIGGGLAELACLQHAMGRSLASVPFLSTTLVARVLAAWPYPELASRHLTALGAGQAIGGIACDVNSEAHLVATPTGQSGFSLSGTCAAVLSGDIAQVLLLPIADAGGDVGLALVDRSSNGVVVTPLPIADATQCMATVQCQDTPVEAECIVTGEEACVLLERLGDEARLLAAQDALGGSEAALTATIEYLKVRVQFGKPIGSFQALKHRCADHKVSLEAARYLLGHAVEAADTERRPELSALAKFQACDTYAAIAADCVQMHGGIGFTWEHDAHLFLKRAKLNQFMFGQSANQQDRAAECLLGQREAA